MTRLDGQVSASARDERQDGSARDERQMIASGPERLPGTLSDVIEAEGSAEEEQPRSTATAMHAWLFEEGAEPRQVEFDELAAIAADDARFVWVDLGDYDREGMDRLARELELPVTAVRTALAGWQRPRLGVFGDRFFVSVTVPRIEEGAGRVLASELDLFVGRNYLVSAHKQPLPFEERARTRAAQNPDLLKLDSAFLLSILLDELLVYYEELTEGMEDDIEALEERALRDTSDAFLEDLLQYKRFVFAVYRLASQHRAIAQAFLRPDFPLVGGEEIEPYFRDLEARLDRLLDNLDAAKETVNGAFDIYVSQVGHKTNDVMKVLTVVSAVLLPATVILSFFGTSFETPYLTSAAGFLVMNALLVVTTVGVMYLFFRWGWLTRSAYDKRDDPGEGEEGAGRSRIGRDVT